MNSSKAISNVIFVASVAVLIMLSATGFGLYGLSSSLTHSNDVMSTVTTAVVIENASQSVYMFTATSGSMVSNAWLINAPLSMNEHAVSIKAEGLEPSSEYIVEATLNSGSMQTVPISTESMTMNTTSASDFLSDANGTGLFWIVLAANPAITFEQVEIVYLPGMSMQNATTVATVSFQMTSSETMTETSSTSGM